MVEAPAAGFLFSSCLCTLTLLNTRVSREILEVFRRLTKNLDNCSKKQYTFEQLSTQASQALKSLGGEDGKNRPRKDRTSCPHLCQQCRRRIGFGNSPRKFRSPMSPLRNRHPQASSPTVFRRSKARMELELAHVAGGCSHGKRVLEQGHSGWKSGK